MKKIFTYAFLLLAASLIAAPASAQTDPAVTETDNVWMKKTVKDNQDGTYTLNLQTYVKGSGEIMTSIAPADIAMVLDFSSSMVSNTITMNVDKEYKERLQSGSKINSGCTNEVYIVVRNGVTYYGKLFSYSSGGTKYSMPLKTGSVPTSRTDCTNSQYLFNGNSASSRVVYTIQDSDEVYLYCAAGNNKTVSRLMGLQIACSNFIDVMYQNPPTGKFAKEHHKISVMPFSSADASTVAMELTEVTASTYQSMKNAVANIAYAQGTRADLGMEDARKMFAGLPNNPDRKRITVFFTDGVPTTSGSNANNFNPTYGKDVVNTAYTIKNDLNAVIYSVALFKSDFETKYIRRYLHWTSSNYKNKQITATAGTTISDDTIFNGTGNMTTTTTPADGLEMPHDFYQLSTGANLSDIFKQIAEEAATGGATVEVNGESSVVLDVISDQFSLMPGVQPKDIRLYTCSVDESHTGTTVKWESGSHDGENWVDWKPWNATGSITDYIHINSGAVEVESESDFLQVTGFDFADNYVGPIMNEDETAVDSWHGKKLIIEFEIEVDPSNIGGLGVKTNEATSGLYVKTTDSTTGDTKYEVLYDNGEPTFYQQPDVNLPYIKIIAEGLRYGQSAVFHVKQVKDAEGKTPADPYETTVVITQSVEGEDAPDPFAIIKLLTSGDYEITQETWTWEYGGLQYLDPTTGEYKNGNKLTQHLSTVGTLTVDNKFLNYYFKNLTETDAVQHAEAAVINNVSDKSKKVAVED